ncbi:hypothetical protein IC762_23460 [Bradyrhizobium genosp. L]|uniref:hypothetical protein n=1 Tax=Bradyrhizobium genosp. L TaxID=83637 RepID=UPI0018A2C9C9|nr:hypothetical protein [Bradyrhizobium genosp. L]QPF82687.1 hypothetical protein IC762_23460 [Bradyrhizobium genosp. L]
MALRQIPFASNVFREQAPRRAFTLSMGDVSSSPIEMTTGRNGHLILRIDCFGGGSKMRHASLPIETIEASAPPDRPIQTGLGAFFLPILQALHDSRRRQAQQIIHRYRHLLSDADAGHSSNR